MEYMIVTAEGTLASIAADRLETKVNEWIKRGWLPHGSVSISSLGETVAIAAQAMVRNTGRNSDQGWYGR